MRGLARGHVDVAIIGTGLTSLSAALYLARKNAMAQVFEKRRGQIGAPDLDGGMATQKSF